MSYWKRGKFDKKPNRLPLKDPEKARREVREVLDRLAEKMRKSEKDRSKPAAK